jgi:hypothetical protein
LAERSKGVVMTLEETLDALKARGVRKASFDASGTLLHVEFEPASPTFPVEPEADEPLDDPYMAAAKLLAKHKPTGAEES